LVASGHPQTLLKAKKSGYREYFYGKNGNDEYDAKNKEHENDKRDDGRAPPRRTKPVAGDQLGTDSHATARL
jgi:hypothetical protein